MDFAEDEQASSMLYKLERFPHVAILRTFSKSFGLAGVRLGYGILPLAVARAVRTVRLPFSVNVLAEEAGLAAGMASNIVPCVGLIIFTLLVARLPEE